MNLSENSEEIVIRHTPMGKWVLGGSLCLIFGGLSVWFILSIFLKSQIPFVFDAEIQSDVFLILLITAVSTVFLFFPSLLSASQMNVIVSRKTKSIDVIRRRIYGIKKERYFFYQIQKFKSYKSNARLSFPYTLALIRSNGKVIKLKVPTGDKNETIKLVKKLNKFIKLSPKDELAEYVLSQNSPS